MKEEQLELDGLALQLLYDLSMGLPSASALGLKRWSSATTSSRDRKMGPPSARRCACFVPEGGDALLRVHMWEAKSYTFLVEETCHAWFVTGCWRRGKDRYGQIPPFRQIDAVS